MLTNDDRQVYANELRASSLIANGMGLNLRVIAAIILHLCSISVLYAVCYHLHLVSLLPGDITLMKWDALWYNDIRTAGYTYVQNMQNSTAFFPLFPAFWGAFPVNALGISIVNLLMFYGAYYFLAIHLRFSFRKTYFWLSIPILFFCYIPYSEALFFTGGALLLTGLDTGDRRLVLTGLIIASLTRSVGIVFIPAVVFTYLVSERSYSIRSSLYTFWYTLAVATVTLLVFGVQYWQTGQWFVFFETQKAWKRELQLPSLPFASFSGAWVTWLDVLALFTVFAAVFYSFRILLGRFSPFNKTGNFSPALAFSLAYGALMGLISIFYSGVWAEGTGSNLMSLPRFIFVSPFFIYAAAYSWTGWSLKKELAAIVLMLLLAWLAYGAHLMRQPFYAFVVIIYAFACFFYQNKYVFYLLVALNLLLQVLLFHLFLSGHWVA